MLLIFLRSGDNVHRVARIFGKKTGAAALTCPRAKYISPRSQLAITGALTLIEVVVNASWLIYEPPKTTHIFPDRYRTDFNSGQADGRPTHFIRDKSNFSPLTIGSRGCSFVKVWIIIPI